MRDKPSSIPPQEQNPPVEKLPTETSRTSPEQIRKHPETRENLGRREKELRAEDEREIEKIKEGLRENEKKDEKQETEEEETPDRGSPTQQSPFRVVRFFKNAWEKTLYPGMERVMQSGAVVGASSAGILINETLGRALPSPILETMLFAGISSTAYHVIQRARKATQITPLLRLNRVAEKEGLAGEIHLSGAKAMKKLRQTPVRNRGRLFLEETANSLQALQSRLESDPKFKDIQTFFGDTNVFSPSRLDKLGIHHESSPLSWIHRNFSNLGKRVVEAQVGGWRSLFQKRSSPLLRISFSRDELPQILERLKQEVS